MLGRGVAAAEGRRAGPRPAAGPLEGVRLAMAAADLAVANLESPLTRRPHLAAAGPNRLEADPASAQWLQAAGFDALGVANNHAGDAGPGTVPDTVAALRAAGLRPVGGGGSLAAAEAPVVVRAGPLRVALLAFDATGQGPAAGAATAGVAAWEPARARRAVAAARAAADIVAVGVHGGAEYHREAGPGMLRIARLLAMWGADVVWGSGPHVVQPVTVIDPDGDGRPTVVATSLGNLLFDQHGPGTDEGALLEVLAAPDGAVAWRLGATDGSGAAARLARWELPGARASAAALAGAGDGAGAWWTLARAVRPVPARPGRVPAGFAGAVTASARGDADGDGRDELVVSFRRPWRPGEAVPGIPKGQLVDARGRSAHVGVYELPGLGQRWVAGTVRRPVARLAACTGTLAIAYSTLSSPAVTGTGAWAWQGFGFVQLPDLPGGGTPACADADQDGRQDALILDRRPR